MFHNIVTNTSINNWNNTYSSEIKDNLDSRSKAMRIISNLNYGETKKRQQTLEVSHKMKVTVKESQVSPTESLDSVGSLDLSSVDDTNNDTTNEKKESNAR